MSRMTPERARELRDEKRDGKPRNRPAAFVPQPGTRKHRELRFDHQHPEHVEEARKLLAGLDGMEIDTGIAPYSLSIWYEISDYSLEGLEAALVRQGFHLDNSVYSKLMRAVVYFCEETQMRNMRVPARLIKKSHDVYSKAWERHPHGDHDETPPELRQEKVTDEQLLRYSRHILLPQIGIEGQEKIVQARALVIGAGGLGSPAALYLASAGIGTLVLADGDTVDLTNLQRQILHRSDTVGMEKPESGKRTLGELNPECHVIALSERLCGPRLEEEVALADIVLDCCDNFATRHAVNRACVKFAQAAGIGRRDPLRRTGGGLRFAPGGRALLPLPVSRRAGCGRSALRGDGRFRADHRHDRHAAGRGSPQAGDRLRQQPRRAPAAAGRPRHGMARDPRAARSGLRRLRRVKCPSPAPESAPVHASSASRRAA